METARRDCPHHQDRIMKPTTDVLDAIVSVRLADRQPITWADVDDVLKDVATIAAQGYLACLSINGETREAIQVKVDAYVDDLLAWRARSIASIMRALDDVPSHSLN
jgi:hypothetical protein